MTESGLGLLLSYILLYKYIALFILMFFAGFIVPLPSNALMLVVGVFVSQGYMDLNTSIIVAILGNVGGDSFGFWLTHRYGDRFFKRLAGKKSGRLDRLRRYIQRSAAWTILITRFSNAVGMVINFLCGLMGVRYRKFILFDAVGNFLNLTSMILLGFFIGAYWEKVARWVNIIGIGLAIILIAAVVYNVFLRKPKGDSAVGA